MKNTRRLCAFLLAVFMVFSLSACGRKGPTADDAEKYVKAVLDLISTGEYDKSVVLVDADDYKDVVQQVVDEGLKEVTAGFGADIEFGEEVRSEFYDLVVTMFSKVKYTVGKAAKVDGGYNVPVTVVPVSLSDDLESVMEETVNAAIAELMKDPNIQNMSEEEIYNRLMVKVVAAMKDEFEKNPVYGEPDEITVLYQELEEGLWGVSEADGEKLGSAMFRAN